MFACAHVRVCACVWVFLCLMWLAPRSPHIHRAYTQNMRHPSPAPSGTQVIVLRHLESVSEFLLRLREDCPSSLQVQSCRNLPTPETPLPYRTASGWAQCNSQQRCARRAHKGVSGRARDLLWSRTHALRRQHRRSRYLRFRIRINDSRRNRRKPPQ